MKPNAKPIRKLPAVLSASSLAAAGLLAVALGMGLDAAVAAPPDPMAATAGPQPSEDRAQRAVLADLVRKVNDPRDMSRVRFLSGPHLVTGVNFAGSREQAWEMCVVVGDARLSHGPVDLGIKPYLLRTQADQITVIQYANWKESGTTC